MAFAALIFYAIAMLIRPHEWGVLVNDESSIVRNSLLLCMAFFVFHQNKNFTAPQFPLMLVLVFVIFLSVVASGWIGGGVNQAELFVRTAFIPFVLISGLVDSIRKQYILFIVIGIAALITVLNGHIQYNHELGIGLMGNPIYRNGEDIRITYLGFLSDPNDLGMFLVMSLPLFFFLKEKVHFVFRPIVWAGIFIILYGVFLTNSRGTLLATLALMGLWFWRKYGTTKSVFAGMVSSPALLVVLSSFREISAEDESAQGRLDAWYAGIEMLFESPLFGVGQGAFTENHGLTAHNSFVLAFAELGMIGCLSWVAILIASILTLLKIADKKYIPEDFNIDKSRQETVNNESKIALILLFCLAAYCVSGFFLSRTYVPILYLYLGMAAATLGRVRLAFPELPTSAFFVTKDIAKFTAIGTLGGIFSVFVLIRVFL